MGSRLASHLIKALGQRRKVSGEETYFIHVSRSRTRCLHIPLKYSQSSLTAIYSAEGGWPYGEVKDTDPIFEKEKEIGGPHPVREVSNASSSYRHIARMRLLIFQQDKHNCHGTS
jgi:hypothetical protein